MARPTTKHNLLETANQQFDKMWVLIDSMPPKEQSATFYFGEGFNGKEAHWRRDKNLRDILVHLYEWHQLLLSWVNANLQEEARPFLPPPYNWKTYSQINIGFWEKHQSTPLSEAIDKLKKSHAYVIALIEAFSNEELFLKGVFSWTGTTTLGSYCVSATCSHYDWAIKKIKQHIKSCKAP